LKVRLPHLHIEVFIAVAFNIPPLHLDAESAAAGSVYCPNKGEGQGLWCSGKEGGGWIHCSISFHSMKDE